LYQIIVSQWGLSLGEIETIKNLFKNYDISENPIDQNAGYASTLEIEFVKKKDMDFFDCITIEKWTDLVEVIKNIKKRRGRKGLKLKINIADYFESGDTNDANVHIKNSDDIDTEREVELLFFKRTIFLLVQKIDSDFIKGLERIEVAIENLTELFKKLSQSSISEDQIENDKYEYSKIEYNYNHNHRADNDGTTCESQNEIQLQIFLFDDKKRVWKNL
jgi:hypothetical protein